MIIMRILQSNFKKDMRKMLDFLQESGQNIKAGMQNSKDRKSYFKEWRYAD